MNRGNGGIFGKKNLPSSTSTGGAWGFIDQQRTKVGNLWPSRPDVSFSNTTLLLKNSAILSRGTTVTDSSSNNFTVTKTGSISTGWPSPYWTEGYWGNYFNGTSTGTYLTTPANVAFQLTTSNFTIEFWAFITDVSATNACICRTDTGGTSYNGMLLGYNDGTNFVWYATSAGASWDVINAGVICTIASIKNKWAHFAFVRNGSTFTAYVNGVQTYTTTSSSSIYQATNGFRIGTANNSSDSTNFGGYISNFRYVKGTAVYTGAFTPSTTPLTAITNTQLLTCQSNRFIDNSTNNFAVTVTGSPRVLWDQYPTTFASPVPNLGAGFFNGSTDYLGCGTQSAYAFGTGVFTIEAWVYINSSAAEKNIMSTRGSAGTVNGWSFAINTSNGIVFYPNSSVISTTSSILLNSWNHIAIVREGTGASQLKLYVNGTNIASGTSAENFTNQTLAIGNANDGTQFPFSGYISNVRLVKGTAVYTGNFTPPTNFLTTTGGTYPSTTNVNTAIPVANTSLLVNLSDSNYTSITNSAQNSTFVDSGPYAFPITRVGTTAQGSFTPYQPGGFWSTQLTGGNYVSTSAASSNLRLDQGNWTLECWLYITAWNTNNRFFDTGNNGDAAAFVLQYFPNGSVSMGVPAAGTGVGTAAGVITLNRWYHIAITSEGAGLNGRIYINGVLQAGPTNYTNPSATSVVFNLGRNNVAAADWTGLQGFMSNFRFVSGQRLYSANFTPPTTPLTRTTYSTDGGASFLTITGTTQLLALQSNRFIDNGANNFTLVGTSSPSVRSFHPFSISAVYTPAVYGGSGSFNGTTDYLSISAPNGGPLDVSGGANFTLEIWFYATSTASSNIWARGGTNGSQNSQYWANLNNGNLQWGIGNGGTGAAINSVSGVVYNVWNHFAVVLVGTIFTPYLNGVAYATATLTFTIPTTISNPTLWIGGAADPGARLWFPGYLTGFRLVKGTAVYTSNFTPPTAPATAIVNANILLTFANAGIYDATAQNYATTQNTARLDNSIYKWPTASMRFNGTNDYLMIPTSSAFAFGTGDLSIECWFYHSAVQGSQANIICVTNGSAYGIVIHNNLTAYPNVVTFWCDTYGAGPFITGTTSLIINNWYHYALTRASGIWRMYINGVQQGSNYTNAASPDRGAGYNLRIGGDNVNANRTFTGYIQDLRITNGVARYTTTTFPVPAETFAVSGRNLVPTVEYLVVAGGGAAGVGGPTSYESGGGGAGGMLTGIASITALTYTITVGAGGALNSSGNNSVFASITSTGGGRGASNGGTGVAGGSGGGGTHPGTAAGAGTSGQGNTGGGGTTSAGGGGGGAGAVGGGATGLGLGGNGGAGSPSAITGITTTYAGGGGGGAGGPSIPVGGSGGSGGGAAGVTSTIGLPGTPNTGGGGGGSAGAEAAVGGSGGSGIVIIAYPSSYGPLSSITAGLTYDQPATRSGYIVYRFTAGTGTISW